MPHLVSELVVLMAMLCTTTQLYILQISSDKAALNEAQLQMEKEKRMQELHHTEDAASKLLVPCADAILHSNEDFQVAKPDWKLLPLVGGDAAALEGYDFKRFLHRREDDCGRFKVMCILAKDDNDGCQMC